MKRELLLLQKCWCSFEVGLRQFWGNFEVVLDITEGWGELKLFQKFCGSFEVDGMYFFGCSKVVFDT